MGLKLTTYQLYQPQMRHTDIHQVYLPTFSPHGPTKMVQSPRPAPAPLFKGSAAGARAHAHLPWPEALRGQLTPGCLRPRAFADDLGQLRLPGHRTGTGGDGGILRLVEWIDRGPSDFKC